MNPQYELVAAMVREDDVETPRVAGMTSDWLAAEPRRAFEFVQNYFVKYRKVPSLETVNEATKVDLSDCSGTDPVDFYIQEILKTRKNQVLVDGMREANDLLIHKPDVGEAMDRLTKAIADCNRLQEAKREDVVNIFSEDFIEDHIELYNHREALAAEGKVDGMMTPWKELDEVTWGIHNDELWTIAARLGTGKTWDLMLFLWKLFLQGVQVLVVSMEMPPKAIANRINALVTGFSANAIRKGRLGEFQKQAYFDKLRAMVAGRQIIKVVGSGRVRTVDDIEFLVDQEEPQAVLVDGLYILNKDPKVATWERVSFVQGSLKQLNLSRDIPIVGTTQFNRSVKGHHTKAGTDAFAFADAIGYDSNVIKGMFQDEDMKNNREMLHRLMKNREGDLLAFLSEWDLTDNKFEFLHPYSDTAAAGSSGDTQDEEVKWD